MAFVWRVAGPGAVFGLKMAPVWRVAGPGAVFGLKMALVWRVAGPGAVFGRRLWTTLGANRPHRAPSGYADE
jgi:hypothetical protein